MDRKTEDSLERLEQPAILALEGIRAHPKYQHDAKELQSCLISLQDFLRRWPILKRPLPLQTPRFHTSIGVEAFEDHKHSEKRGISKRRLHHSQAATFGVTLDDLCNNQAKRNKVEKAFPGWTSMFDLSFKREPCGPNAFLVAPVVSHITRGDVLMDSQDVLRKLRLADVWIPIYPWTSLTHELPIIIHEARSRKCYGDKETYEIEELFGKDRGDIGYGRPLFKEQVGGITRIRSDDKPHGLGNYDGDPSVLKNRNPRPSSTTLLKDTFYTSSDAETFDRQYLAYHLRRCAPKCHCADKSTCKCVEFTWDRIGKFIELTKNREYSSEEFSRQLIGQTDSRIGNLAEKNAKAFWKRIRRFFPQVIHWNFVFAEMAGHKWERIDPLPEESPWLNASKRPGKNDR